MEDKKGYGIVIPNDWGTKEIEKLSLEVKYMTKI